VNKLIQTQKLVKIILESDEKARNSDSFLYFRVLNVLGKEKGLDMDCIPVTAFLLKMKEWGFPPFESVRRSRQRVQQQFPELSAKKTVAEKREENEEVYRQFARSGA
jgi:hypothetical protein